MLENKRQGFPTEHSVYSLSSNELCTFVTRFYAFHAGLVSERESQMATEPESTGERSATTCPGKREHHQRRRTPVCGLSVCHTGGQQQPASFRRRSSSSPPRPNHADTQLRRLVLATPFTVPSTIQFLQTAPHHVARGGNIKCTYEIFSNFMRVGTSTARHSHGRYTRLVGTNSQQFDVSVVITGTVFGPSYCIHTPRVFRVLLHSS